jgi:hypothetical protein
MIVTETPQRLLCWEGCRTNLEAGQAVYRGCFTRWPTWLRPISQPHALVGPGTRCGRNRARRRDGAVLEVVPAGRGQCNIEPEVTAPSAGCDGWRPLVRSIASCRRHLELTP